MKLSKKDADILASLYDSTAWQVFRKHFIENRQMELAQQSPFLPDFDNVLQTRGKIVELKQIETSMDKIRKNQDKKDS